MANCKVGDRVIVVGGKRNLGKIYDIIAPIEYGTWRVDKDGEPYYVQFYESGPIWQLDGWAQVGGVSIKTATYVEHFIDCLPDQCLRPLIDDEGEDETLSWKEVPSLETV